MLDMPLDGSRAALIGGIRPDLVALLDASEELVRTREPYLHVQGMLRQGLPSVTYCGTELDESTVEESDLAPAVDQLRLQAEALAENVVIMLQAGVEQRDRMQLEMDWLLVGAPEEDLDAPEDDPDSSLVVQHLGQAVMHMLGDAQLTCDVFLFDDADESGNEYSIAITTNKLIGIVDGVEVSARRLIISTDEVVLTELSVEQLPVTLVGDTTLEVVYDVLSVEDIAFNRAAKLFRAAGRPQDSHLLVNIFQLESRGMSDDAIKLIIELLEIYDDLPWQTDLIDIISETLAHAQRVHQERPLTDNMPDLKLPDQPKLDHYLGLIKEAIEA